MNYIVVYPFAGIPAAPTGDDMVYTNVTTSSDYETTGGSNADTYIWQITPADAGTISGTGLTGTVQWNSTYTGLAEISVKGVNDCGESNFSDIKEVTCDFLTGFNDNSLENAFSVFPNPSNGNFAISFNRSFTEPVSISVYNTLGDIVYKSENAEIEKQFTQTIDLNVDAGIYYLRIEGENFVINKKIIIN